MSHPFRSTSVLLALVVGVALGACGDEGPAPEPGFVTVRLVSPAAAEGGAVFQVAGDPAGVVSADATVFTRPTPGGVRVLVVREPAGELAFRMEVEDVRRPPFVALVEVAGPDDALREDLGEYRVEVEAER